MPRILMQFDFPFTGPWGADMTTAMQGLAHSIAQEPGLLWKIWTENKDEGRSGGIYLFQDEASADAYTAKHSARLTEAGVTDIRALKFHVNEPLSAITRLP